MTVINTVDPQYNTEYKQYIAMTPYPPQWKTETKVNFSSQPIKHGTLALGWLGTIDVGLFQLPVADTALQRIGVTQAGCHNALHPGQGVLPV